MTRVKKKSFILTTLLLPIIMFGLISIITYFAAKSNDVKRVAVYDASGYYEGKLQNKEFLKYDYVLNNIPDSILFKEYDGYIEIPKFDIMKEQKFQVRSDKQLSLDIQNNLSNQLNKILIEERYKASGINKDQLAALQREDITLKNVVGEDGVESSAELSMIVGYFSSFLLYFFIMLYGMSVMQSVMEEKTNRIAEVIISSVKPMELMMGKIVGVILVGFTQMAIWAVFFSLISIVTGVYTLFDPSATQQMMSMQGASSSIAYMDAEQAMNTANIIATVNWGGLIVWFIFYFFFGYLLYASLYAGVGSLVNDSQQDVQQFSTILTLPIILSIVIVSGIQANPNSPLAVFGSIFPFTSPIVMMSRIPGGVPDWQLWTSAIVLVASFFICCYGSAKIYRTGILMYGKKVSVKEVMKWLFKR